MRLDLDGDGTATIKESLGSILQSIQTAPAQQESEQLPPLTVTFDDADVVWLAGYCHMLSAMAEMVLAYDWEDQFERTAHLFYPKVDSPYEFLEAEGPGPFMGFGVQNILDLLAWIHTINYEVTGADRMKSALAHMETVIALSRRNWELIEAETDDDQEWVPNPNQTAALPGLQVARGVVTGWHEFLEEVEAILQGKKLIPFWRGIVPAGSDFPTNPKLGINVRRVFTEPTRFDFVLWLQGTGLLPYLEEGDIIDSAEWQEMMSRFQGQFFNFALWFN